MTLIFRDGIRIKRWSAFIPAPT